MYCQGFSRSAIVLKISSDSLESAQFLRGGGVTIELSSQCFVCSSLANAKWFDLLYCNVLTYIRSLSARLISRQKRIKSLDKKLENSFIWVGKPLVSSSLRTATSNYNLI